MQSRPPIALLVVWIVALFVVGAGAVAAHDDGDDGVPAVAATTSTSSPTTGPAPVPGETTTSVAGGTDTATTVAAPGGADDSGQPATTVAGETAPRTMPVPGRYRYRNQGTSSMGEVPAESETLIEQLSDTDQRSTSQDNQGQQISVLRYTGSEIQLVRLEQVNPALTKVFEPNPPVLYAPVPPTAGQQWEWTMTSTDGRTTIHQTATVVGAETLTIGGQPVDTAVVEAVLTLSGDLTGTTRITVWGSTSDSLAVRTRTVSDVTFGVFRVTGDVTSELVSLSPS